MSFVCFLSSVDCNYFICSDFNIHCTDSRLGRLGDPGVSPPPKQWGFVIC